MGIPSQPLLYDWAGKPTASDTSAAPVTSRPGQALYTVAGASNQGGLVWLGSDYAATPKAQVARVDGNGVLTTVSAYNAAAGMAIGNPSGPVCMGMASGVAQPLQLDAMQNLVVAHAAMPTFTCVAAAVSISSGKSMLALVNGSTGGKVLRLVALYAANTSTTTSALGNTYNIYAAELRPITGVSATGTTLTPLSHDTMDTLDAGVKLYAGATVTGDNQGAYRRWVTSNYGLTTNATNAEAQNSEQQGRFPWVQDAWDAAKPITIRPGSGIHVRIASTATVGFLDLTCVFTQGAS